MNKTKSCPVCSKGSLTAQTEQLEITFEGKVGHITTHFSLCDACGAFITDNEASKANKRAVLAYRKSVQGLLSSNEIKNIRIRYGLTQDTAHRLFGGGPKAFSKYESDEVIPSAAMDKLLRVVHEHPAAINTLYKLSGLTAPVMLDVRSKFSSAVRLPISYSTSSEDLLSSSNIVFKKPVYVGAMKQNEYH